MGRSGQLSVADLGVRHHAPKSLAPGATTENWPEIPRPAAPRIPNLAAVTVRPATEEDVP